MKKANRYFVQIPLLVDVQNVYMYLLLLVLLSVQMLVYEYMENGTLRDNISGMFYFFTESSIVVLVLYVNQQRLPTDVHCS
jgi:hypothetical protein